MNLEKANLFVMASRRLQWLSDRQRVVSENIANADTAGYRAREVESFGTYLEGAQGKQVSPAAEVAQVETAWAEDMSGNNVVLEEQILQATSTAGQYRMASNLYRKAHELLLTVASGR